MSLLIPTEIDHCGECWFARNIKGGDKDPNHVYIWCGLLETVIAENTDKRPDECPIKEVTE